MDITLPTFEDPNYILDNVHSYDNRVGIVQLFIDLRRRRVELEFLRVGRGERCQYVTDGYAVTARLGLKTNAVTLAKYLRSERGQELLERIYAGYTPPSEHVPDGELDRPEYSLNTDASLALEELKCDVDITDRYTSQIVDAIKRRQ